MVRPTKKQEAKNYKDCLEYYEDFKSAGYAAARLGLNRHTVESYYRKYAALEITPTTEEFIKSQVGVKARALTKLDRFIDKANAQIARFESLLTVADASPEGINMERLLQKSITDLNNLYGQKAALELTPTLDIHIDSEIAKRFGTTDKDISKDKRKRKE